ncbi:MAG: hypothetical protein ABI411_20895 [Tahibacter sp.]
MKLKTVVLVIAAAIATVVSSVTGAVSLNPDGTGQVLLYPYYTVNANNATLISVVNPTDHTKAVRVRFREGYNGQSVFEANVFLGPFDVWTANVFSLSAAGGANLLTDDESCTLPDIKGATGPGVLRLPDGRSYRPFSTANLQTDGGPTGVSRTREGSLEILDMARLQSGSDAESAILADNGVPAGCGSIEALIQSQPGELLPPSGGLFGAANIVDPALGTLIGYNADALEGFYHLSGNLYFAPGSASPALDDARTTTSTAVAYVSSNTLGAPSETVTATYSAGSAVDAVSAVLTQETLLNEFVLESGSASESEWVISFPTKHHYVGLAPAVAPFIARFAAPGRAPVVVGYTALDRDQGYFSLIDGIGVPTPFPPTTLNYETQILSFLPEASYLASGGVSAVFSSRLTTNIDIRGLTHFPSGWLRLQLNPTDGVSEPHALRPSQDGDVFSGLPVTGFLATNYLNRNNGAFNVLATYSTAARHRGTRKCVRLINGGSDFCS